MKPLGFIPLILLLACNVAGTQISGTISNAAETYVALDQLTSTKAVPLDSVMTDASGQFKLNYEVKEEGFYRLRLAPNNFVILLLSPADKNVQISGNAIDFFRSYTVSGSVGSVQLKEVDTAFRTTFERIDSLRKVFVANQANPNLDSLRQTLDAEATRLEASKRAFVAEFIDRNPTSLATLSAVQVLPIESNLDLYKKVNTNLAAKSGSEYVKQLSTRLTELETRQKAESATAIGSPAPELKLTSPDGQAISLEDFKGKITLIDFWASWCGPCRQENPNVLRVYNRFKSKGFEIFGVSLDKDKAAWQAAIAKDGLTWKHGSELNFWQSSFVPRYRIEGIPMTYLIDANGIIIEKGLRGQQLEQKLEELLR